MSVSYEIIPYQPDLNITNWEKLSRRRGLRYLEVIRSHIEGQFIAERWHRVPKPGMVLIDFRPHYETFMAAADMIRSARRQAATS